MKHKMLLLLLMFLITKPFEALAGFGVSPYYVYNKHLKPGSVYETEIILSRSDSEENLQVTVEPEVPQISSWFTFKPGSTFNFPKGQNRFPLKVVVTVPQNADLKNYQGVIRVKASPQTDAPAGGVSVVKGARLEVDLITTNIDVSQITVEDIQLEPSTTDKNGNQKVTMHLKVKNDGNTPAGPTKVTLNITDTLNNDVAAVNNVGTIPLVPAGVTKIVDAVFNTQLPAGEFIANARVYLNDSLIKEGKLMLRITTPALAKTKPVSSLVSRLPLSPFYLAILSVFVLGLIIIIILIRRQKKLLSLIAVLITILLNLVIYLVFNPSARIKGVSTTAPVSPTVALPSVAPLPPVNVVDPGQPVTYSIYQKPNILSPVVYVARDGESLTVISQSEGWYQVKLPSGIVGWLPQTSVKSAR